MRRTHGNILDGTPPALPFDGPVQRTKDEKPDQRQADRAAELTAILSLQQDSARAGHRNRPAVAGVSHANGLRDLPEYAPRGERVVAVLYNRGKVRPDGCLDALAACCSRGSASSSDITPSVTLRMPRSSTA